MGLIGIDIGACGIRAVQLAANAGGGMRIKAAGLRHFHNATEEEIGGAIKDLVRRLRLKGKAAVGLSAEEVKIFSLSLPAMPAAEIADALRWQAGEILDISPDKIEGFSLDYDILQDAAGSLSGENSILAAVASKDAVLRRMQEIRAGGLEVIAAEPDSLALFAAVRRFLPLEKTAVVGLLDMGCRHSSFSLAAGDAVYLVRDVSATGKALTDAVKNYFQIDYESAERLKCEYGIKGWGQEEAAMYNADSLLPAVASGLENLVVEMEHAYQNFSRQFPRLNSGGFGRIIICQGAAKLKGLDSFLGERLGVAVELFNPFDYCQINNEMKGDSETAGQGGPIFSVAVGLALRGER